MKQLIMSDKVQKELLTDFNTIHPDDREQVIKDIGGKYYGRLTYETTYRMAIRQPSISGI